MITTPFSLKGLGLKGEKSHERYRRLVSLGKCGWCGGMPRENMSTCESCGEWTRKIREQSRQKHIAQGKCHRCGADNPIDTVVMNYKGACRPSIEKQCLRCYLNKIALMTLGTTTRWEDLVELFKDQEGRCSYTGIPLVIGQNANLDHKIPVRGGSRLTTIDNLQWVYWKVNLMKNSMEEDEFIKFCKLIAARRG